MVPQDLKLNKKLAEKVNMPYKNLPKRLWPKMERCVAKVKRSSRGVNPYAVCFASIKGKKKKK